MFWCFWYCSTIKLLNPRLNDGLNLIDMVVIAVLHIRNSNDWFLTVPFRQIKHEMVVFVSCPPFIFKILDELIREVPISLIFLDLDLSFNRVYSTRHHLLNDDIAQ